MSDPKRSKTPLTILGQDGRASPPSPVGESAGTESAVDHGMDRRQALKVMAVSSWVAPRSTVPKSGA